MSIFYLKQTLYEAIEKWIKKMCETSDWTNLDMLIGDDTIQHLTDIVISTILACAESQQYRERELEENK